jgi:hypothetical protein
VDLPNIVIVIGSSRDALRAREWELSAYTRIVAINNAWAVRPDWHHLVHPKDFPPERLPQTLKPGQQVHSWQDYVPAQNRFGGFVYAGGTMVFTTAYWALATLRPAVLAFIGCDMVYPVTGPTHFYGTGTPDPLRPDPTLQSLEAKSARLQVLAAQSGCLCVNLSVLPESRLIFPRLDHAALAQVAGQDAMQMRRERIARLNTHMRDEALGRERELGYYIEDGRYWRHFDSFDAKALADLDNRWLLAAGFVAPKPLAFCAIPLHMPPSTAPKAALIFLLCPRLLAACEGKATDYACGQVWHRSDGARGRFASHC